MSLLVDEDFHTQDGQGQPLTFPLNSSVYLPSGLLDITRASGIQWTYQ